jgi:antitoxin component of RelBE/YafQ-DinJ toxin-antitoxin module
MQKDSFVSIRVSKETKNEATRILGNYGYTLSSYINVLLSELVKNGYPQLELIKALAKEKNI